jgi:dGTPase
MLRTSSEHLLWELEHLARYAEKGGSARGRRFPEPEHPYRTPFERDRDRIIHSRSFRRLEAKTQVFVKRPGQPYRTRLTHTLEVAQVSRTAAHALRLNEDLTEAIALAHDLGHPPFGHAGERVLNELGQDVGGFDHNRQSLRIVDLLESRYAAFPGLNLTWEVREGLGKHGSGREAMPGLFGELPQPSLEAQVVDVCDEVAYNNHDVDDGLASGLLSLPQVLDSLPLWRSVWEEVAQSWPNAPESLRISETVRTLIDRQTTDIMNVTLERLKRYRTANPDEARKRPNPIVNFSPEMGAIHQQQREFLFAALYRHPEVMAANDEAVEALRVLFKAYQAGRMTLEPPLSEDEAGEPHERRIVDTLACMTDDQALFLSQRVED